MYKRPQDCDDFALELSSAVEAPWLERTAIESSDVRLSYRGLLKAVEDRAANLRRHAAARQVVTLERRKSVQYVIDFLAVLCMGAIAAPIDPGLPALRRKRMRDMLLPALEVHEAGERRAPGRVLRHEIERDGDTPAYICFTSGSTGAPKAIIGSRNGLLRFIRWQGHRFDVGPGDRVSFLTGIGFDVSLRDILLPLLHGATLVVPDRRDEVSPQAAAAWLARSRITRVHVVPSIASLWARSAKADSFALRTLFLAGEKLKVHLVHELRDAFPGIERIANLYGPTETTLARFCHCLDAADIAGCNGADVPVGRPLPDTRFFLAAVAEKDWWLPPCAPRRSGEVVIVAADTSFGYVDSPAATRERFHGSTDGMVAYRTGDLGRLTADGDLVIVGRCDDEVKINGVRIHPLEVENTVATAPMVRDVAVVAGAVSGEEPRLMAFWTTRENGVTLDDAAPRDHALSMLPRALVPTIWVRLDALPVNINGKIDRALLPDLAGRRDAGSPTSEDDVTRWVLRAVADILDVDDPGPSDDFFALGGTSLDAAFMIGRMESELGTTLDFSALFESSRLESIAELVRAAPASRGVTIEPVATAPEYPLAPQQRRWWNIYLPMRNRSWATMVKLMRFDERYSREEVRSAVIEILRAQVALRLFFSKDGTRIRQHVANSRATEDLVVAAHDLGELGATAAGDRLEEIRLAISNQEIDPYQWPLFRVHVAALPDERTSVIFAIHHMIADGFSMGIIENALRAYLERGESHVPVPSFDYLSYAQWALDREARLFGPNSPAHEYWRDVFRQPYRKIVFPERWTGDGHDRGRAYCCRVPDRLRDAVADTARRERLTEFSVYLAAKFMAWHETLGRDDIVIGTPAAGRDVPGSEDIVGNFISLVCMRSRLDGRPEPIEYTRALMHSVARAMTCQGYQYDRLVRDLGLEYEQDRFPLTTIFVSYLNFASSRARSLPDAELGHSDLGFAVKFDVMAYVREHAGATSLQLQYRSNLFEAVDMAEFADRWVAAVREITACPGGELPPEGGLPNRRDALTSGS